MKATAEDDLPKVLIVEDDVATSSILNIWLRNKCHVFQACDGDEALVIIDNLLQNNQFINLFIFDISLPRPWTGITLKAEIIDRWKIYHSSIFIAESAFAMPHDQELVLGAGFIAFFAKPLDRVKLLETVEQYLYHRL
jgi:CheY-like chemotaxis protein